jgi:2,4-didehydro-3-deoxy-L-rhamnonate hydrolase
MKLIRFGEPGKEKPGFIDKEGERRDVSEYISNYDEAFFEQGGLEKLSKLISNHEESFKKVDESIRLGSPINRPSKIICVGLNYSDHARESNMQVPKEPIIFFKSTSALCGPNDNIILPKGSEKTDWEVELAIVIGKRTSYVEKGEAMDYVAGYVLHNDYSEREFQIERSGQWVKGKSCDTFAPLGPFLATKDEIQDVHNLRLWLKVNGKTMQDGNTSNLIFDIPFLVSYISQFMTLLPGDVISTGTPAGVGLGFNPPVYLKPNDVVELGIEGLGSAVQQLVEYKKLAHAYS